MTKRSKVWSNHIHFHNYLLQCLYTLKNVGLKTTQLGLFGNPALGKYWTEHMLGYFDPAGWIKKKITHHAGLFNLSHLLFKMYYIAGLKWAKITK